MTGVLNLHGGNSQSSRLIRRGGGDGGGGGDRGSRCRANKVSLKKELA